MYFIVESETGLQVETLYSLKRAIEHLKWHSKKVHIVNEYGILFSHTEIGYCTCAKCNTSRVIEAPQVEAVEAPQVEAKPGNRFYTSSLDLIVW
jgi:hypothetical protein